MQGEHKGDGRSWPQVWKLNDGLLRGGGRAESRHRRLLDGEPLLDGCLVALQTVDDLRVHDEVRLVI